MGPSSCRKTSSASSLILHYGELYNYLIIYHNNNRNKVHNKCNALESSQNSFSRSVEKLFLMKWIHGSKKRGGRCPKELFKWTTLLLFPVWGNDIKYADGKDLPAMQETQVLSLGPEDPLEKKMTVHSSTLPWKKKIPWTEEPGGPPSSVGKESDMTQWLSLSLFSISAGNCFCIKEGCVSEQPLPELKLGEFNLNDRPGVDHLLYIYIHITWRHLDPLIYWWT